MQVPPTHLQYHTIVKQTFMPDPVDEGPHKQYRPNHTASTAIPLTSHAAVSAGKRVTNSQQLLDSQEFSPQLLIGLAATAVSPRGCLLRSTEEQSAIDGAAVEGRVTNTLTGDNGTKN